MGSWSFRNGTDVEGRGGALKGGQGASEGWALGGGCSGDSHSGDIRDVPTWHLPGKT